MPDSSFTSPEWKRSLSEAQLTDFDSWWNAEGHLVEEGNFWGKDDSRYWSHVTKLTLPNGEHIYLKRQQNHRSQNILHRIKGRLTFQQEWKNYQTLQAAGIPTMEIVYFNYRKQNNDKQCILASAELKGMISLSELIEHFESRPYPPNEVRRRIFAAILKSVKALHGIGMIHNALKPKHMFINIPIVDGQAIIPDEIETCFIDFERGKYVGPQSPKFVTKDLEILLKHWRHWPIKDILWFLKAYDESGQLTPLTKKVMLKIIAIRRVIPPNQHPK